MGPLPGYQSQVLSTQSLRRNDDNFPYLTVAINGTLGESFKVRLVNSTSGRRRSHKPKGFLQSFNNLFGSFHVHLHERAGSQASSLKVTIAIKAA